MLTLESKNAMGHNMRLTHDFSQDGKLTTTGEMSPDGKTWSAMFDGTYERQA